MAIGAAGSTPTFYTGSPTSGSSSSSQLPTDPKANKEAVAKMQGIDSILAKVKEQLEKREAHMKACMQAGKDVFDAG